jgi:hypothetical protein
MILDDLLPFTPCYLECVIDDHSFVEKAKIFQLWENKQARERRRVEKYRAMTGMAMKFIKEGMDKEMVKSLLIEKYERQIVPVATIAQKVMVIRPHKVVQIFSARGSVMRRRGSQMAVGKRADVRSGVG